MHRLEAQLEREANGEAKEDVDEAREGIAGLAAADDDWAGRSTPSNRQIDIIFETTPSGEAAAGSGWEGEAGRLSECDGDVE